MTHDQYDNKKNSYLSISNESNYYNRGNIHTPELFFFKLFTLQIKKRRNHIHFISLKEKVHSQINQTKQE